MPEKRVRPATHRGSGAIHSALDHAEAVVLHLLDLALTLLVPLLALWVVPRLTLGATIGVASLPVQILVVLVWLTFLFAMVVNITTERFARSNWRRGLELFGRSRWAQAEVVALLAGVLGMAWTTFSGLTCVLRDLGWAQLSPDFPSADCLPRLQDHYAWHFLDTVPAFQIPETLRWNAPYTYTDTTTGALILLYKAAIVLPLIGGYRLWRRIVAEEVGRPLDIKTRMRRLFA